MAQVSTAFQINLIRHISLELFVYSAITRAAIFFPPQATRVSILSPWITAKMPPDRNLIEKSSWTAPSPNVRRHWWMIDRRNTKRHLKDRAPTSSNWYVSSSPHPCSPSSLTFSVSLSLCLGSMSMDLSPWQPHPRSRGGGICLGSDK